MGNSKPYVGHDIRQIADKEGNPYLCHATDNVWVGKDKEYHPTFAKLTEGNEVTPITTGKEYFKQLLEAIDAASEEVLIAGWQVSWDVLLAPGVRLFDIILKKAGSGVKFYIMPWDDTAPVQTYDDQTASVFNCINEIELKDKEQRVFTLLAASDADSNTSLYSNHQKQVVVDRKTAFIGGIDLSYGRYDDATYNLNIGATPNLRVALNRYNPCIEWVGELDKNSVCDPDLLTGLVDHFANRETVWKAIKDGAYQVPYETGSPADPRNLPPSYKTVDDKTQPRMPWQDVHTKIVGPAVSDLTLNFVLRWNALVSKRINNDKSKKKYAAYQLALPESPETYPKTSTCKVQVLRSAPAGLLKAEFAGLSFKDRERFPHQDRAQTDIMHAMLDLIAKAERFIYIENQFFQSCFGEEKTYSLGGPAALVKEEEKNKAAATRFLFSDADKPIQNSIAMALADRIGKAILDRKKPPFHVIITLPVHPEGKLNDGAIMSQVHWTMQSLHFGSQSLLNRIRRYLRARELYEQKAMPWCEIEKNIINDPANREYDKYIEIEECFEYVTLLNLRNWTKLGEQYVTEQIYVHSKLMIVDDLYAIVGSANINDRSLLGSRDSELAVMVVDTADKKSDTRGDGKPQPARTFAQKLRVEIWSKIFGVAGKQCTDNELKNAIDKPGSPDSWKKIKSVADKNQEIYENAFPHIPRNLPADDNGNVLKGSTQAYASIWPAWKGSDGLLAHMPFNSSFWIFPRSIDDSAARQLDNIQGYITSLPIRWTENESNDIGYHHALVTMNESDTISAG